MNRALTVLLLAMVLASLTLPGQVLARQDEEIGLMPVIVDGTCKDAAKGDGLLVAWPLTPPEPGELGSGPYPEAEALTTTAIDASFDDLVSESRSIVLYNFLAEDEMPPLACGDLASPAPDGTEWSVELPEHDASGIAGHAVLTETASDEVSVALYVWSASGGDAGTAGGTTDGEIEQPSGPGGIGNTREDILAHWDIRASDTPTGELFEDGFHYVVYDLPDYQIAFMFLIEEDETPRPTDRAVDIVISWIESASRSEADRRVAGWLPDDAERVGSVENNAMGEAIYRYHSDTVAEMVPDIDHPGFDEPGGIWVTYWPADTTVGVVEISLFHPRQ